MLRHGIGAACAFTLLSVCIAADAAVTGVATAGGKPVAAALIRVVDAADSTREAQALTDAQGRYSLVLPAGSGIVVRPVSDPGSAGFRSGYDVLGRRLIAARVPSFRIPLASADAAPAAPTAKGAAARAFRITVWGKGVLPYRESQAALADGDAKDFHLTSTDLWDSARAILRDDISNCAARFQGAKQGRVAFLGGSITFNPGWRDSVAAYLKKKFPSTAFEFINAGIPSVGSDMHGFRLRRDVLAKGRIDLLFLESAVNDTTNKIPSQVRRRAYEGIVRQARRSNPRIDIAFLYFLDPSFYPDIQAGRVPAPIADYEAIATQYGIPALDLARSTAEHYTWQQFGGDVHPGAFGQGLYAHGIVRMLEAAWSAAGTPGIRHVPVTPMDAFCFQEGHADSISKGAVVNGWKRVESWTPTQGGTRDGFYKVPVLEAAEAGDTLKFAFNGTAVGIVVPAGPDVGMLDYAIDGKPMGTRDQFTPWSSGLNIPWTILFAQDLPPGPHELRLATLPSKNPQSTGHACRIIRFVVNGPG